MRRAFFSFHYQRDIIRVSRIRNSWVTRDREAAGFWDGATWESIKRQGDEAIKRWINTQLNGTSVTVVLIGAETAERKYVKYEIQQSHNNGKGLLGIYIHNMRDFSGQTSPQGRNPFENFYITQNNQTVYLSQIYSVYDWVTDDGYNNIGDWIESAARRAGR